MFSTPKENHARNLERLRQSSLLTKNTYALFAQNPLIRKNSNIVHFFSGVFPAFSLVKLTCLASPWNEVTIFWNEVTLR